MKLDETRLQRPPCLSSAARASTRVSPLRLDIPPSRQLPGNALTLPQVSPAAAGNNTPCHLPGNAPPLPHSLRAAPRGGSRAAPRLTP